MTRIKRSCSKTEFAGRGKVEISRFKGLGEMEASDLKKTTIDPKYRAAARGISDPRGGLC